MKTFDWDSASGLGVQLLGLVRLDFGMLIWLLLLFFFFFSKCRGSNDFDDEEESKSGLRRFHVEDEVCLCVG